MSDLPKQFDPYDIEKAQVRAQHLPEGWDWDRFVDWLNLPGTLQKMADAKGPDWTLADALNLLSAPALSNTERGRLGMRRVAARRKGVFEEEFEPTPGRGKVNNSTNPRIKDDGVEPDDPDQQGAPPIDPQWLANETKIRLARLMQGWVDVTHNDVATASRMVQAEAITDHYYAMLATAKAPAKISALNRAIEQQAKIADACQKALGIDRAKRQADSDKRGAEEKVLEVIEAAGRFALEQAIQIIHCDTLIGWVITEFREVPLTITGECPKCHAQYRIEHIPSEQDIAGAVEPEWVANEEAQYDPNAGLDEQTEVPNADSLLTGDG